MFQVVLVSGEWLIARGPTAPLVPNWDFFTIVKIINEDF